MPILTLSELIPGLTFTFIVLISDFTIPKIYGSLAVIRSLFK